MYKQLIEMNDTQLQDGSFCSVARIDGLFDSDASTVGWLQRNIVTCR